MSDIYATPEAELEQDDFGDRAGGNIDDAVEGNFKVSMTGSLGDAWRGLKGFKFTCILAFALYFLVMILVMAFFTAITSIFTSTGADQSVQVLLNFGLQIVVTTVGVPMWIAIMIMGIRHAEGKSVSCGEIFKHFSTVGSLLLAYFIMLVLIMIGFALLVLPGLYLTYAYMFALPLIVEKKMSAWQALETSRKAVTKVWFRFFGFTWLLFLINMIASIPFGLGLIWTVPLSVLAFAMIYIKIFGAEVHTLAD